MRARDIMKKNVIFVSKEEKVKDIVSILMQNHVSGVPVVDNNKQLVGIVTEKDLITKEKGLNISSYLEFVASILFIDGEIPYKQKYRHLNYLTASDIMSSPVYAVHLDATIGEIASIMMNRRINRIPVINERNQLVGIIGRSDLLPTLIK
nr:CBS domain-containing protein [uncultured Cellulosilyticum sp.]